MGKFGRIRALGALLHVRKLITQRRDPTLGESVRDADHKRMRHAGARTMRQHITDMRVVRRLQETGDTPLVIDVYSQRAWSCRCHLLVSTVITHLRFVIGCRERWL